MHHLYAGKLLTFWNKTTKQKTFGTIPKSNWKIVEIEARSTGILRISLPPISAYKEQW